ncbi:indolepyruvate ferredoxin oxidoreductase subunit alpha [Rhizobium rhizogenes]|uniref:indolepyruvate ferredoxin oxidoreductase subunit alpha n=1 Tax=Rhizobium rhizogenes TaxID=359 RepID=UPI0015739516|nr:ferredoxin family protein [Rhizobium rhizogenes]NTH22955.1 4Fe-4S binding protein [Rhizobium rhizogenes]NTH35985.1 4Fe-4S binding protein [Rhizobium rhizogenes]
MTHVVTENCAGCRFTDCVEVCPVSCFHGDENRIFIDPEACIDCGACLPLCPVNAICEDFDLEGDRSIWLHENAEKAPLLPVIKKKLPPLEGAGERRIALGHA